MQALALRCINQYTKVKVPSFTNYKDMIGAKLKKVYVTRTTPLLGVVCHRRLGFDTVYLHTKFDDSISAVPEISLGASKFKVAHETVITPLSRVICHPYAGT